MRCFFWLPVWEWSISPMAYTLFAMAFTKLLISVYALFNGTHHLPRSSISENLAVNGLVISLFVLSGVLFKRADGIGEKNPALNAH